MTRGFVVWVCLSVVGVAVAEVVVAQEPDPAPQAPEDPFAAPDPNAPVVAEPAGELAPAEPGAAAAGEAVGEAEVSAEEAAPETPVADERDRDEIIVTGTRISSFPTSAARVDVVGKSQLEQSGNSNLADLTQYLTGGVGAGIQGGVGAPSAAAAASSVNLRGLGVGTTLILLNGRRINPSGYATFGQMSDLSTVPLAAVGRVDILKAGASAIYGADAVGGVINIITRRGWDGARFELDGKTTQKFDLNEYTLSASFGANSERSRVMGALSYFRRSDLFAGERPYTDDKYQRQTGFPGAFQMGPMSVPDPACGNVPGSRVIPVMNGNACWTDVAALTTLIAPNERANLFLSGEFDLSEHVTAFAEATASRQRSSQVIPELSLNQPFVKVPANHIDNTIGGELSVTGAPGLGPRMIALGDDSVRGVIGFRGDFGGLPGSSVFNSWQWEVFAATGISRFFRNIDDNLRPELQAALNSCSDPENLGGCFNPFYSSVDGTGTPNSQAVLNRIQGREVELSDHAMQIYNIGLNGPLLELPGGPLAFALGGELRQEWRTTDVDYHQNQGEYTWLGQTSDFEASRSVYSAYLELVWPVLKGLTLQAAARLERYSDTDKTATSPFAGLVVELGPLLYPQGGSAIDGLSLRTNISSSFRAPNVSQTNSGVVGIPGALRYMGTVQTILVENAGNPDLKPETALTVSAGANWDLTRNLQVNLDFWSYDFKDRIAAQSAQVVLDTWVMNGMMGREVALDPTTGQIGPLHAMAINVPGSITTNGLDFGVTLRLDGSTFGGGVDDFGTISASLMGTYTFRYDVPMSQTSPRTINGMPVYVDCEGQGADAQCDLSGKRNIATGLSMPKLKFNLPLAYSRYGHTVTAVAHYASGVEDDGIAPAGGYDYGPEVPAWLTLDLQYAYTLKDVVGKSLTLRIGCENLFDREPSPVNGTAAYLADLHDPRGRIFYAKLSSEF